MTSVTPNECAAAHFLVTDGYSTAEIGEMYGVHRAEVDRHIRRECNCPRLEEPREISPIDGEELRSSRTEAGLTQAELAEKVDTNYATISQVEREKVTPRPKLRIRILDWIQENGST